MEEQQPLMSKSQTPKYKWQETDMSKYFHAGNIIFGKDGDVFIHGRATQDKDLFLKILIHLHERFIEGHNEQPSS